MDDELVKLMGETGQDESEVEVRVLDIAGTVEVQTPEGPRKYVLKELKDLYGAGVNAMSIVPDSPEYTPLCMGIETAILQYWRLEPALTDGQVSLALDRLGRSPESAGQDGTGQHVQLMLRLVLSTKNYSRKDVQRVLRVIDKSVARHTRDGGRQGYLTFIRSFLG